MRKLLARWHARHVSHVIVYRGKDGVVRVDVNMDRLAWAFDVEFDDDDEVADLITTFEFSTEDANALHVRPADHCSPVEEGGF